MTTTGMLRARAEEDPGGIATRHRLSSGEWSGTTWLALWKEVCGTAAALRRLGLVRGQRVAIMTRTCREWQIAELAVSLEGASVVGVDRHAAPEQIAWMLDQAQPAALVVDDSAALTKIDQDRRQRFKFIICVNGTPAPRSSNEYSWDDMHARAIDERSEAPFSSPKPDDPATVIFTSGTSGFPKAIGPPTDRS